MKIPNKYIVNKILSALNKEVTFYKMFNKYGDEWQDEYLNFEHEIEIDNLSITIEGILSWKYCLEESFAITDLGEKDESRDWIENEEIEITKIYIYNNDTDEEIVIS